MKKTIRKYKYDKFDISILKKLDEAYKSSPIFSKLDEYNDMYHLCDTVLRRIGSAIEYLNNNIKYPMEGSCFITFVVYACMIRDGVYTLYERVIKENPFKNDCYYFKHAQENEFMHLNKEDFVCDDRFFEYIRSIVFAHPFTTNRTFKKTFGTQLSSRVIPGYSFDTSNERIKDPVGAEIFINTNDNKRIVLVEVSLKKMLEYLNSRYMMLEKVTEWFKNKAEDTNNRWKCEKCHREIDPIDSIAEMNSLLVERFRPNSLYQLWFFMSCKYDKINEKSVSIFRKAIKSSISDLQDATDNLDYDRIESIVDELVAIPKHINGKNYYRMEKIFRNLPESELRTPIEPKSDEEWGLIQAKEFSDDFAKRWVIIDTQTMSNSEIKLLAATACYMENHKKEFKNQIIKKDKN